MKQNEKRDLEIKAYYLAGGTRQEAMQKWDLTTGPMAGISTRNGMHWSWPLENRRSGKEPSGEIRIVPFAQPNAPRKQGEGTGGIMRSIQARQERKIGPDIEIPADAALYQTGSAPRRYGKPISVLTRERRERGYQDSDFNIGGECSPYPAPSKELPFNDITFLIRHLYEGKPLVEAIPVGA